MPWLKLDPSGLKECVLDTVTPTFEASDFHWDWTHPEDPTLIGFFGGVFEVDAIFSDKAPGCCTCCEYRQCVYGLARARWSDGDVEELGKWGSIWHHGAICQEDYTDVVNKKGKKVRVRYGHRDDAPRKGIDEYLTKCNYKSKDEVGVWGLKNIKTNADESGLTLKISWLTIFTLQINDVCNGDKVKWTKEHTVDFGLVYDGTTFKEVPNPFDEPWDLPK